MTNTGTYTQSQGSRACPTLQRICLPGEGWGLAQGPEPWGRLDQETEKGSHVQWPGDRREGRSYIWPTGHPATGLSWPSLDLSLYLASFPIHTAEPKTRCE